VKPFASRYTLKGGNDIDIAATRRLSAALFGNEKVAEVVMAIEASHVPCTAQELAVRTSIGHSMVRDVLVRMTTAGVLVALPKIGGTRSPQYYEPPDAEAWLHVVALARWLSLDRSENRSPN